MAPSSQEVLARQYPLQPLYSGLFEGGIPDFMGPHHGSQGLVQVFQLPQPGVGAPGLFA